jgi:hypothetical protein
VEDVFKEEDEPVLVEQCPLHQRINQVVNSKNSKSPSQ